jgi:hypothetical protein
MYIDEAVLLITCRKFGFATLLKTTSLRQFQIAQTKAHTPRKQALFFLSISFSKLPRKLVTLAGSGIL